jgi:hypothetical protein
MDANKVATFSTLASELLGQVTLFAAQEPSAHSAEDNAQVRQLRVATAALNVALEVLARISPPPMPPPPIAQPTRAAPPAASSEKP